jgi:hypothetical protein
LAREVRLGPEAKPRALPRQGPKTPFTPVIHTKFFARDTSNTFLNEKRKCIWHDTIASGLRLGRQDLYIHSNKTMVLLFINFNDYSIHLSFVKNGPIKTQFYTFVTMVSKKLDRIFPLVEIVSVIPLLIPMIIFNK